MGKKGGIQVLNLNRECASSSGEVIHELLHTLGFYHEHQREDSDDYINIIWENVLDSSKCYLLGYCVYIICVKRAVNLLE